MNGLGTGGFNLLYIILLLVPGILGIDLYLRFSKKRGEYSRLRAIVYSIGLSITSLTILYLLSFVHFSYISNYTDKFASGLGLVTGEEISSLSLVNVISFYLLHVIVAALFGLGMGFGDDKILNSEKKNDRREPWTYIFDEVSGDGEPIQIVTSDGELLEGSWSERAWSKTRQDLYIEDVVEVTFNEEEPTKEPVGRGVYLHQQAISRVVFPENDPDTKSYGEAEHEESGIEEVLEDDADNGVSQSFDEKELPALPSGNSAMDSESKQRD